MTTFGTCGNWLDLPIVRTYSPQQALQAHNAGRDVFASFTVPISLKRVVNGEADQLLSDALATFQKVQPRYLSYGHEPENDGVEPADWQAAWLYVRQYMAPTLVNTNWFVCLMASTFGRLNDKGEVVDGTCEAGLWYPGKGAIAPDGYNWCPEEHPTAKWRSLETILKPAVIWRSTWWPGKKLLVPEFGCYPAPGRQNWLDDAIAYCNAVGVETANYFNRTGTSSVCNWTLSAAEAFAFESRAAA